MPKPDSPNAEPALGIDRRGLLAAVGGVAAAAAVTALPQAVVAGETNVSTPIQRLWSEYCAFKPKWHALHDPNLDVGST
jgi:hypothetical protein